MAPARCSIARSPTLPVFHSTYRMRRGIYIYLPLVINIFRFSPSRFDHFLYQNSPTRSYFNSKGILKSMDEQSKSEAAASTDPGMIN